MYSSNRCRIYKTWLLIGLLIAIAFSSRVYAQTDAQMQPINWQLYSFDQGQAFNPDQPTSLNNLQKAAGISLVGGHYLYAGDVSIDQDGLYVIDFKNTSVIDHFAFYLYDPKNKLIASATGGIGSKTPNPFFLRHGRMFHLKAGQYKLLADVSSPYYIAEPVPYVEKLAD
ncbi:MAG: hypothetical protein R3219_08810, partial [Hydrogenovibrio sp.]|nr:hypothetical protein [Hydrogenovibrio sp.]